MKLPHKKSRVQRLASAINPLERSRKSKLGLPHSSSIGVSRDQAVKAGLIAGGLAGLTAASAGLSSLRRTARGRNDS
jgi:hypothetical protein